QLHESLRRGPGRLVEVGRHVRQSGGNIKVLPGWSIHCSGSRRVRPGDLTRVNDVVEASLLAVHPEQASLWIPQPDRPQATPDHQLKPKTELQSAESAAVVKVGKVHFTESLRLEQAPKSRPGVHAECGGTRVLSLGAPKNPLGRVV